jgi:dienelactone hydrolase
MKRKPLQFGLGNLFGLTAVLAIVVLFSRAIGPPYFGFAVGFCLGAAITWMLSHRIGWTAVVAATGALVGSAAGLLYEFG